MEDTGGKLLLGNFSPKKMKKNRLPIHFMSLTGHW